MISTTNTSTQRLQIMTSLQRMTIINHVLKSPAPRYTIFCTSIYYSIRCTILLNLVHGNHAGADPEFGTRIVGICMIWSMGSGGAAPRYFICFFRTENFDVAAIYIYIEQFYAQLSKSCILLFKWYALIKTCKDL